jgi:hypothetical protein
VPPSNPTPEGPDVPSNQPVDGAKNAPTVVLVEFAASPGASRDAIVSHALEIEGLQVDESFGAIPMGERTGSPSFVVRAQVTGESVIRDLESRSDVVSVFRDAPIAPFWPD